MVEYNAIILGGGRSLVNHALPKGNTPYNGSCLAGKVYEAVRSGHNFKRIALVMQPDEKISIRSQDVFVNPTFYKGALLSGYNGIKSIDDGVSDYVIIAGDLPFLEQNVVNEFVHMVEANKGVDILLPLVEMNINEKMFPNRARTYQPLKEGDFLVGNIGYLSQKALRQNEDKIFRLASAYEKKSMAVFNAIVYLGLFTVLRSNHKKLTFKKYIKNYEQIFPKFSIKELEEVASEFSGVNVKLVLFPYPESAFDIDNIKQLKLAQEILKSKTDALEAIVINN